MRFPTIELFDWIKRLPHDLIDLGNSGLQGPMKLSELDLDFSELPLQEGYFYGYDPLRKVLAAQIGVPPQNIALTPGASMANFALLAALVEPGDRVMVESPCYQPFVRIAESLTDRTPDFLERLPTQNYHLDPPRWMELESIKPKVLIISNLHNPTGILDSQETITALAAKMDSWGGHILVDEVFLPFIEGGECMTSGSITDNVSSVCSLTKVWGLGSLRVGWAVCNEQLARRVEFIMDHLHVVQPFLSEYIAYRVLDNHDRSSQLLKFARERAQENVSKIESFVNSTPQLEWTRPDDGIMALARFTDGRDSASFCERLLAEFKTLVIPGHYFRVNDGFRFGFGADPSDLEKGLGNIAYILERDNY